MKTHARETHESLSTQALVKLIAIAIFVISAITVILLVVVDMRNEKSIQPSVEKSSSVETSDTGPVGGPYIPYSGPGPAPVSQPARPASSNANSLDSVDRVLASMNWANIAFNAPEKISLKDRAQIQLLLSLQKSMEELRGEIAAMGKREGAKIKVSNRMEAHLSSQEGSFKILKITPEEQAVGSIGTFEWKWEVEPLAPGIHSLYLNLVAHFSVDGTPTRKSIRTFEKKIEVEVPPEVEIPARQQALEFIERNWQWLWVVILVPIARWLWPIAGRLWRQWKGPRVGRKK
jgi:hypothetical protein